LATEETSARGRNWNFKLTTTELRELKGVLGTDTAARVFRKLGVSGEGAGPAVSHDFQNCGSLFAAVRDSAEVDLAYVKTNI
jgi:hypothetical protein